MTTNLPGQVNSSYTMISFDNHLFRSLEIGNSVVHGCKYPISLWALKGPFIGSKRPLHVPKCADRVSDLKYNVKIIYKNIIVLRHTITDSADGAP